MEWEREWELRCEEDLHVGEKREFARLWMEGRRRGRIGGILFREPRTKS